MIEGQVSHVKIKSFLPAGQFVSFDLFSLTFVKKKKKGYNTGILDLLVFNHLRNTVPT